MERYFPSPYSSLSHKEFSCLPRKSHKLYSGVVDFLTLLSCGLIKLY